MLYAMSRDVTVTETILSNNNCMQRRQYDTNMSANVNVLPSFGAKYEQDSCMAADLNAQA